MTKGLVTIEFYYKQDCHLCDAMSEQLQAFLVASNSESRIEVVMHDIEDNVYWYEKFREYVPVLVVNQVEVCHYFLDKDELSGAING